MKPMEVTTSVAATADKSSGGGATGVDVSAAWAKLPRPHRVVLGAVCAITLLLLAGHSSSWEDHGTLRRALSRTYAEALVSGAIVPKASSRAWLRDGDMDWLVVTAAPHAAAAPVEDPTSFFKGAVVAEPTAPAAPPKKQDPFALQGRDPRLVVPYSGMSEGWGLILNKVSSRVACGVASPSPSVAVVVTPLTLLPPLPLNKFPTLPEHTLLVTDAGPGTVDQAEPFDAGELELFAKFVHEIDAVGFYNSAKEAGASQKHRHVQLVPLDALSGGGGPPPMQAAVDAAYARAGSEAAAGRVLELGPLAATAHGAVVAPEAGGWRDAVALEAAYLALMKHVGAGPHNLVLTERFLLAVARSGGASDGVGVNGMAFSGVLLVTSPEASEALERVGPVELLRRVCRAA